MAPRRARVVAGLAVCAALLCAGSFAEGPDLTTRAAAPSPVARNPRRALRLQRPGLSNFHRVSPVLYRGAQPTRQGLDELRRLGVRTVVSLRAFHGEREMVAAAGLGYERISFKVWHPEDEDLRRFLAHCQRGADRTGTATAVYRICVEGWSREEAIEEMVNGGFAFERRFGHLKKYLRAFDERAVCGMPVAPVAP